MKLLTVIFLGAFRLLAQQPDVDFSSPQNIKKFADHLFCEKDFLRAAEEYQRLTGAFLNDTVIFKTGICFYTIEDFDNADTFFSRIFTNSPFYDNAQIQKNIILFRRNPEKFYHSYLTNNNIKNKKSLEAISKLAMISSMLNDNIYLTKEFFFESFNQEEKKDLLKYFEWKNDPPYKNPVTAGILSAVIPGSGKIYTEEYGDGILAFLSTGLLTFLAYDNFKANHKTRGWIFASLGTLFYAGNIYGSIASAQVFNARINFEFKDGINFFLKKYNYFIPEYGFRK